MPKGGNLLDSMQSGSHMLNTFHYIDRHTVLGTFTISYNSFHRNKQQRDNKGPRTLAELEQMDALKDMQSVVQISQVEDRLRNFRYDGSVCSEWSEPHPFIRQRNYVYKKAADAKE